ncbi:MAG: nucleoside-diphosphate kinase [Actinomycetota bacterium]
MENNEQITLVLVKPDGVRRGLIGEVIGRLERKKLKIRELRMLRIDKELAGQHYAEHSERPFFPELIEFITSGDVVAMAVQGEKAVSVVRTLMGETDPKNSPPGTLRGDFGLEIRQNIVHGSDSEESAARELNLYFPDLGSGRAP